MNWWCLWLRINVRLPSIRILEVLKLSAHGCFPLYKLFRSGVPSLRQRGIITSSSFHILSGLECWRHIPLWRPMITSRISSGRFVVFVNGILALFIIITMVRFSNTVFSIGPIFIIITSTITLRFIPFIILKKIILSDSFALKSVSELYELSPSGMTDFSFISELLSELIIICSDFPSMWTSLFTVVVRKRLIHHRLQPCAPGSTSSLKVKCLSSIMR